MDGRRGPNPALMCARRSWCDPEAAVRPNSASCVPRPGRTPYEMPRKSSLIDRVQQRDHRPLEDLALQHSDRERASAGPLCAQQSCSQSQADAIPIKTIAVNAIDIAAQA
jgi:hypothetical protein